MNMNAEQTSIDLDWPIIIGSKWTSKTMPGRIFLLNAADSYTKEIRMDCGKWSWTGMIHEYKKEFEPVKEYAKTK